MVKTEKSPVEIRESSVHELKNLLEERPSQLFAILDACDEPQVPRKVEDVDPERVVSLYRGWAERDYWAIAPYLFQVDAHMLQWIVDNLWGKPWGFFCCSDGDLAELRKHFRQFLTIEDADGDSVYFRFYDPRVLSVFLASCRSAELDEFFGPIQQFYLNTENEILSAITKNAIH